MKGFLFQREDLSALGPEFGSRQALSQAKWQLPHSLGRPLQASIGLPPPCCSPASTAAHLSVHSDGEKEQLGESCVFELQGDL